MSASALFLMAQQTADEWQGMITRLGELLQAGIATDAEYQRLGAETNRLHAIVAAGIEGKNETERKAKLAVALEQPQHHNLDQPAHMQAVRCGVEADIRRNGLLLHQRIERLRVRALKNEAARRCLPPRARNSRPCSRPATASRRAP